MTLLSIEHVEPLGQWDKFFDGNIVISRDKCNLMDFRIYTIRLRHDSGISKSQQKPPPQQIIRRSLHTK
jgi:hypothetical protein